jgi:hypothetical protein
MINKILYYLFKFICRLFPDRVIKLAYREYNQKWSDAHNEYVLYQEQLERDRKKAIEESFREWLLEEAAIGRDHVADANSRDLSAKAPLGYSGITPPEMDHEKFWGKK